MNAALNRLDRDADRIDAEARRDIVRRAEAARALRGRCAPYTAVLTLEAVPAPLPVVGLSELACSILALVAHFVTLGAAGVQVGGHDLAWRFLRSPRAVWYALTELREAGWLIVTPDYVPAAETALGAPYITLSGRARKGKARSLRSDDPDAYGNSRVRNLYTLGVKSHAAGFGARCGKPEDKSAENTLCTATLSALPPDSGSGSGSGFFPVGVVDNSSVSASPEAEIDGSAPSSRSTFPPTERDGDSLLAAALSDDATASLVADARGDVDQVGDGDGSEAVNRGAARRGLFGAMGQRLARLFGRGDS